MAAAEPLPPPVTTATPVAPAPRGARKETARAGAGLVAVTLMAAGVGMLLAASAAVAALALDLGLPLMLALEAAAIGAGLCVVAWSVRRVVRGLETLTREAEALRDLDIGQRPVRVASGVAELDRLGDAMRQMKQALGLFGVYVPRDLVRQLVTQGSEVRLGGERRQLTVMFTDVQDFTRLSEPLDPEEVMRITSTYFEAVTAELLRNHATIDKYIGDAVMAMWNAPRRDLAHAMHACFAALRARRVTVELAERFAERGWPRMHTRFGLHSGEAVVGNVGSSDRVSYTAIGSIVNLASRLEGLNKHYGTQILVSEATARGAGGSFVFRPVDLVTPKGTGGPVEIHELVGLASAREADDAPLVADPALVARLPAWREMLLCYRTRRFDAAEAALERAGGATADRLAAAYAGRLAQLRAEPPGPDWSPAVGYQVK
jgi:adenylate cyclase